MESVVVTHRSCFSCQTETGRGWERLYLPLCSPLEGGRVRGAWQGPSWVGFTDVTAKASETTETPLC